MPGVRCLHRQQCWRRSVQQMDGWVWRSEVKLAEELGVDRDGWSRWEVGVEDIEKHRRSICSDPPSARQEYNKMFWFFFWFFSGSAQEPVSAGNDERVLGVSRWRITTFAWRNVPTHLLCLCRDSWMTGTPRGKERQATTALADQLAQQQMGRERQQHVKSWWCSVFCRYFLWLNHFTSPPPVVGGVPLTSWQGINCSGVMHTDNQIHRRRRRCSLTTLSGDSRVQRSF